MQKQFSERILCTLQSDMAVLMQENTCQQSKYAQSSMRYTYAQTHSVTINIFPGKLGLACGLEFPFAICSGLVSLYIFSVKIHRK